MTFERIKIEFYTLREKKTITNLAIDSGIKKLFASCRYTLAAYGRILRCYDSLLNVWSSHTGKSSNSGQFKINPKVRSLIRQDSQDKDKVTRALKRSMQSSQSSRVSFADFREHTVTRQPYDSLTMTEKLNAVVTEWFKDETQRWHAQYEEERSKKVPVVICRMCNEKFYADKAKKHSEFCAEKQQKIKGMRMLD